MTFKLMIVKLLPCHTIRTVYCSFASSVCHLLRPAHHQVVWNWPHQTPPDFCHSRTHDGWGSSVPLVFWPIWHGLFWHTALLCDHGVLRRHPNSYNKRIIRYILPNLVNKEVVTSSRDMTVDHDSVSFLFCSMASAFYILFLWVPIKPLFKF